MKYGRVATIVQPAQVASKHRKKDENEKRDYNN